MPKSLHAAEEEPDIPRRYIGQRMRPVFEHALVDALGPLQMRARVTGDTAIEDMMVAAFDHIDRVDLHVAEMLDREPRGRVSVTEWRGDIAPLGMGPDGSGL